VLALVAAALVAYHNTLQSPFIFDDEPHIVNPAAIRHLWPLSTVLSGTTRPLVQLSLGLNYAVSGLGVWSYHVVNLVIHALAGIVLFLVVRLTLRRDGIPERFRRAAGGLALVSALIWVLHPLQTESVTYVIQRAESLGGLFYLLTLYCAIRGWESKGAGRWYATAVACCALGLASKQIVVTAPIVVLIYDRLFLSRSFRRLWSERQGLYLGLLATWALLPPLFANGREDWQSSAGLNVEGITLLAYAATEPGVILHYLRLCLWPAPLVLDYGWPIATQLSAVVVPALVVAALIGVSIWLLSRGNRIGFLGVWFFLILAPTSSFIPVADLAFEHRLYLSLAAVAVLAALGGCEAMRRLTRGWPAGAGRTVTALAVVALVGTLAALTIRRNADYQSRVAIWSDTVAKRPANPRAHASLGLVLVGGGRADQGIAELYEALRLDPDYVTAHVGLGYALSMTGRPDEALAHLRSAVRLAPGNGESHYLLGVLLQRKGAIGEAYAQLSEARRYEPGRAATHYYLGTLLETRGRWSNAIASYAEAVRLKPDFAEAHSQLGLALEHESRFDEARSELEAALALQPGLAAAKRGLEEMKRGPR
jgi:protein O-mannosyl-transferase